MGMSRMHFDAIAKVLHSEFTKTHDPDKGVSYEHGYEDAVLRTANRLAVVFGRFNTAFSKSRFVDAIVEGDK